ncbi:ABC1 kinase family protein [Microbacterium hydrocarbonoxydans]|uniref:ABC1 kinase family protein n=1 Tax=Microbacterium hydrocarbonoxydans TaxID=273678 RepID=UPI0013DABCC6|nr:AarF/UbiB family protein [Microbacterium hydrocarbonoxydans]
MTDAAGDPVAPGRPVPGFRTSPPRAEKPHGIHRARYRRILSFAAREFLQIWWFELVLPRFGMSAIAERTRPARMQRFARRFHALAVGLGGLMIKVGQFMSSRLDVLPPEITAELEGLQDEVPAVPFAEIRALAEAELGVPLERAYAWVDENPVAAASLGQVHRARLSALDAADTGLEDVVVKVQRPGIDEIVAVDLAALRRVAGWLRRVRVVADRVDAPALVEEFATTSLQEIDYLHEAANAERFAENFADDPRVDTPSVVWERSTRRVLTLSDVTAIKINDRDALRAAGIDPSEVADVFAQVMFDQVFTHSFVHADPHPGNIFVTPQEPDAAGRAWRLTFVDFGMMAEVPDSLRDGLRTLLIAVTARDSRGLVRAAQQIGVLLPAADTRELERALTALFARFGGMGFAELSRVDPREFRDFAAEFGDVVRSLPLQLPENMLLLIRAVSLTSGMCSGLNPAFNVWDAAEPYAAGLLRDESGNLLQAFAQQAASTAAVTWRLPQRIDDIITRIDDGDVSFDTSRLERRLDGLMRVGRRAVAAVLFAGLVIGGALLLAPAAPLGTGMIVASALPLLYALFAGVGRR